MDDFCQAGHSDVNFVEIQRKDGSSWVTVYNDASWETMYVLNFELNMPTAHILLPCSTYVWMSAIH